MWSSRQIKQKISCPLQIMNHAMWSSLILIPLTNIFWILYKEHRIVSEEITNSFVHGWSSQRISIRSMIWKKQSWMMNMSGMIYRKEMVLWVSKVSRGKPFKGLLLHLWFNNNYIIYLFISLFPSFIILFLLFSNDGSVHTYENKLYSMIISRSHLKFWKKRRDG